MSLFSSPVRCEHVGTTSRPREELPFGQMSSWLSPSDVVGSDASARNAFLAAPDACTIPREPQEAIAALPNELGLRIERCDVIPSSADLEWDFETLPLQSFSNAERACASKGWTMVKGWMVLKAGSGFVTIRHWWCRNAAEQEGLP